MNLKWIFYYVAFIFNYSSLALAESANINPMIAPKQDEKIVSVYLLIDKPEQLQQYMIDLSRIQKPNFNRVLFSFVKPTLINYNSESLAETGILGYYTAHDGKGAQAFQALKAAIKLSKEK